MPPTPIRPCTSYRSPKICSMLCLTAPFLPQVRLDHGTDDGGCDLSSGGFAAEVPAVEDDNRDRDPGGLSGGEGREPGVGRASLAVRGGAGLPGDLDARDRGTVATPAVHHRDHHLGKLRGGASGDRSSHG